MSSSARLMRGGSGGSDSFTRREAPLLAWGLAALSLAIATPGIVLLVMNRATVGTAVDAAVFAVLAALLMLTFALVGALVASRRSENPLGWLFLGIAFVLALAGVGSEYATRALVTAPGSLPAGLAVAWVQNWIGFLAFPIQFVLLLVLFPDGRLPSPRWRVFPTLLVATTVLMIGASILTPTPFENWIRLTSLRRENPTGTHALDPWPYWALNLGYVASAAWFALAGMEAVQRLRRASGDQRAQMAPREGSRTTRSGRLPVPWTCSDARPR